MNRWIPTGSLSLDRELDGGLPPNGITLFYGEAETGKTTLAMQCSANIIRMGYKTLFIDSDNSFSLERLSQIAPQDFEQISASIILVEPSSFTEQAAIVDSLERYVNRKFGLIVLDTSTSLYRSELGDKKETFRLNRELNRQIGTLAQLAKSLEITIVLTSQVRSTFEFNETRVRPVATRVIRFWSGTVVSLMRMKQANLVKATVEKAGGKESNRSLLLSIDDLGVHDCNQ